MKIKRLAFGLTALISPLFAFAAPVDPTDVSIPSSATVSTSAYADYAPDQEIKLQSWQTANAAAADESGHAGHGAAGATAGASVQGGTNQNMNAHPGEAKAPAPAVIVEHAGHGASALAEPTKEKAAPIRANAGKPAVDESAKAKSTADESAKAKSSAAGSAKTGTSAQGGSGGIIATGNVLAVDKANGKVKVAHDPIPQIGWPKMTMYFRVKDPALLDRVTEGPARFVLEKSGSGYVISEFRK